MRWISPPQCKIVVTYIFFILGESSNVNLKASGEDVKPRIEAVQGESAALNNSDKVRI